LEIGVIYTQFVFVI